MRRSPSSSTRWTRAARDRGGIGDREADHRGARRLDLAEVGIKEGCTVYFTLPRILKDIETLKGLL
jgi:hypothetical protein